MHSLVVEGAARGIISVGFRSDIRLEAVAEPPTDLQVEEAEGLSAHAALQRCSVSAARRLVSAKTRGALRRRAEWFARREAIRCLGATVFSIISDDCWGGELYRLARRPFLTPFVGLFVPTECFLTVVESLETALRSDVIELSCSRYPHLERQRVETDGGYPLGLLVDVDAELHFMHYPSFQDAREKWLRRRERVRMDALFLKIRPPHSLSADAIVERFARLPYERKLVVADRPFSSVTTAVVPHHEDSVVQLHAGAVRFDPIEWLSGGTGEVRRRNRLLRTLKFAGWR